MDSASSMASNLSNSVTNLLATYSPSLHNAITRHRTVFLGLTGASLYLLLCQVLRFNRLRRKLRRFSKYGSRADFAKMTTADAFEMLQDLSSLEFPELYRRSLDFALFRTYGIPTISKLLRKTNQLSGKEYSSKRIADTAVLVSEFTMNHPESERHNSAISRMNYIHGIYQNSGQISNDDMLYTLALFALEPPRWIERWEWREFVDVEKCAAGTYWKSIGDAMGIKFDSLPSGPDKFVDGLQWFNEIADWADKYEERVMLPDQNNHDVAERTTAYLLDVLPEFMKPMGKHFVFSVMDDRLRKAMLYPQPPIYAPIVLNTVMQTRKFLLRHFVLPRVFKLRAVSKDGDSKTGRFFLELPMDNPWYMKPTFANRFGFWAIVARMTGKPYAGSDAKYRPEGYHIHEVGPHLMAGKGMKEYEATRDHLMAQGRGGCPFAFAKSE